MRSSTVAPSPLDHQLQRYFSELASFPTTGACVGSRLFGKLRPELERVLGGVEVGLFATGGESARSGSVRVAAWNVERGIQLDGVLDALLNDPVLRTASLWLLTEVDYGMARTGNRHVAREIAAGLGADYVFAPCYLALNKGAGVEADAEGENTLALHGNAIMSRYPLHRAHAVPLPNGKDKMVGREKRLGSQRAVIADVEHPLGMFRAVSLHLDAHSSQAHRRAQMSLLLDHLDQLDPELPILIGGDWNTTTHNASRAFYSIMGYALRVLMGVRRVLRKHYPHPDRWFERRLFRELEDRGFSYRDLNVDGACTLHYSIRDLAANKNMGEWIPAWCFWFINWALAKEGGRCSLKVDWFAGKGLHVAADDPDQRPAVIEGMTVRNPPLSDHDPIVVGFTLAP